MLAMTATPQPLFETTNIPPPKIKHGATGDPMVNQGTHVVVSIYAPREDLFLEGDEASHLLELTEGVICAYRLLPDGQRHVVSFYFPGDLIGYCCSGNHTFSAQALNKVRARRIPRILVNNLVETQTGFARRLLKLASEELTMTREHLLCVAAKSAEARMAVFLLALSRRNALAGGDASRIELPMTRVDIGDYLGLTIETVSRTFSKLKRSGVIALPRTTVVIIRDAKELDLLANG